jgi:DNA-binding transcriptional MerR regulator
MIDRLAVIALYRRAGLRLDEIAELLTMGGGSSSKDLLGAKHAGGVREGDGVARAVTTRASPKSASLLAARRLTPSAPLYRTRLTFSEGARAPE